MAAHQGDSVHEGRRRLVVPGCGALGHGVPLLQRVGGQGDPGEEPQQDGRGAGDGQVRPLALGLHAQVGPHLLKGALQLPKQDKPLEDLGRIRRRIGTEQSLGVEGALVVSDQHPANEDGRLAGSVPDRRLGGEFHLRRLEPVGKSAGLFLVSQGMEGLYSLPSVYLFLFHPSRIQFDGPGIPYSFLLIRGQRTHETANADIRSISERMDFKADDNHLNEAMRIYRAHRTLGKDVSEGLQVAIDRWMLPKVDRDEVHKAIDIGVALD